MRSNISDMVSYSTDEHCPEEWEQILQLFKDATLYQTYAYARVCYGPGAVSTIVVSKDGNPLAAALVHIRKLPRLPWGVAYVFYGPLWRRIDNNSVDNYAWGIKALVQEYVKRRGHTLRIKPFFYENDNSPQYDGLLQEAGLKPIDYLPSKHTLLVNLEKPVDELRRGLEGKWRGHLNRSERNDLTIIEGTDLALFEKFQPVHAELLDRKQLNLKTIDTYKNIQLHLPDSLKMKVFLCEHKGRVCAGIIVSTTGEVGITLSRATSEEGKKQSAAFLTQWRALQWLKAQGCHWYDLSGIHEKDNPGTYRYKKGLCGNNGSEVQMMNQYQMPGRFLKNGMISVVERGWRSLKR